MTKRELTGCRWELHVLLQGLGLKAPLLSSRSSPACKQVHGCDPASTPRRGQTLPKGTAEQQNAGILGP